jgi:ABC-2 type transport system permease protein
MSEVEPVLARLREAGCASTTCESASPISKRSSSGHEQPEADAAHEMDGFRTLLYKEVLRFWKVSFQTVAAPVLTALLYLLIFSHVLDRHVQVYGRGRLHRLPGARPGDDVGAAERLRQQLVELIQSKVTGNIIFVLLPPISYREFFAAYVLASIAARR